MAQSNVNETMIRERYPTLIDWDDTDAVRLLIQMITDAEFDVEFGEQTIRERAISALVAHRMILKADDNVGDTGSSWLMSKAQAGQVSMDFVTPPPEFTPAQYHHYYTTKAGIEYVELLSRTVGGMRLVE